MLVGNRKLMDESGVDVFKLDEKAAALAGAGKTPMFVAVEGEPPGLLAVRIRSNLAPGILCSASTRWASRRS